MPGRDAPHRQRPQEDRDEPVSGKIAAGLGGRTRDDRVGRGRIRRSESRRSAALPARLKSADARLIYLTRFRLELGQPGERIKRDPPPSIHARPPSVNDLDDCRPHDSRVLPELFTFTGGAVSAPVASHWAFNGSPNKLLQLVGIIYTLKYQAIASM